MNAVANLKKSLEQNIAQLGEKRAEALGRAKLEQEKAELYEAELKVLLEALKPLEQPFARNGKLKKRKGRKPGPKPGRKKRSEANGHGKAVKLSPTAALADTVGKVIKDAGPDGIELGQIYSALPKVDTEQVNKAVHHLKYYLKTVKTAGRGRCVYAEA